MGDNIGSSNPTVVVVSIFLLEVSEKVTGVPPNHAQKNVLEQPRVT